MYFSAFFFFFAINRSKIVVVDINRFLSCCYYARASLDPALRSFCFRLEIKNFEPGPLLFLVLKYVLHLDPTNLLYWRHLIYIYRIYVSEKLGLLGERCSPDRGT